MFAFSPRKELILRVVLIAAILINATIPTVVLAKPLNNNLENQIVGVGENKTYPLIENNYPYPNLERPISRTSENLPQHNSSQSAIDHDATITCLGIYCSDSEPGILVTQNYNGGTYPYLTFSIQCPSSSVHW